MARSNDARVILVGGASAEDGVAVYPRAELGNLDGFKAGFERPISMPDGFNYQGAKAYKDSKLCLSMLSTMLHDRYYKQMGVAFSTVYPVRCPNRRRTDHAGPPRGSLAAPR